MREKEASSANLMKNSEKVPVNSSEPVAEFSETAWLVSELQIFALITNKQALLANSAGVQF